MTGVEDSTRELPLIQYWHDDVAPPDVAGLLTAMRARNPDLPRSVFSERTAERFIAERFGDRHCAAFRACAHPAMQSDYFRYCAIYALAGFYVDVDLAPAGPLRQMLSGFAGCLFQSRVGTVFNDAMAFRLPDHRLLRMAIEIATLNIENRVSDCVAFVTGPGIFTGLLQLSQKRPLERMCEVIAPVWRPRLELCLGDLRQSFEEALAICGAASHLFDGVQLLPLSARSTWLYAPNPPLPYKSTAGHWMTWDGPIFRFPNCPTS